MTRPRRPEPRIVSGTRELELDVTPALSPSSSSSDSTLDPRQIPAGAVRIHNPRADALWVALARQRVVVASGEGYRSAHLVDEALGLHDQAIGRPNDKLWGTRIDPAGVRAPLFAAIAHDSAGKRTVMGRRLSTIARRYLAAGPEQVFIGVEGEIAPRLAAAVADELMTQLVALPFEPISVIARTLTVLRPGASAQLVVIGNASLTFARALEAPPPARAATPSTGAVRLVPPLLPVSVDELIPTRPTWQPPAAGLQ